MKLLIKVTIVFVLISSIVFLIGAIFTFNAMSSEIEKEEQYFLEERLTSVIKYLDRRNPTKKFTREKILVIPLDSSVQETKVRFSDTLVTHSTLQRIESHLKLDVIKRVNDRPYKIVIYDLIVEEDDIADAVKESMIKTFLLLLGVSLLLSVITSYLVFKPFQETLTVIKNFSIRQDEDIILPSSTTSEFNKLNRFITDMTGKAKRDYQSLKEFSENASHEIQTPLSIAQGKLDLLMESGELTKEQMELISSAQHALKRLSKMGNSLSLLTKIENKEFSNFSCINISSVVTSLVFDFNELISLKTIKLLSEVSSDVKVNGNQALIEILVTNLLNNAVRHNHTGGLISLNLTNSKLEIRNTGEELKNGSSGDLFKRFKKGSDNPDSTGLGLSIVKKICDEHGFIVDYSYQDEQHVLTVRFGTPKY